MKKHMHIAAFAAIGLGNFILPQSAFSITTLCNSITCTASVRSVTSPLNCAAQSSRCYNTGMTVDSSIKVNSCTTCKSGYELSSQTLNYQNCNNISWNTCVKSSSGGDDCDGTCDDCESTSWTSNGTGRQTRVVATCDTATCKCSKITQTRCIAGYYGTGFGLNGSSGCDRCPSGGSSIAGTTKITGCYINSGSDATGAYVFTSPCYYTE